MPLYTIKHVTRYIYEETVPVCHNMAHLLPRASPRHQWRFADLAIDPTPAVRTDREDFFGNRQTFFAIQEPHRQLEVTARGEVDVEPRGSLPASTVAWEDVRNLWLGREREFLAEMQFTLPSPYVQGTDEVAAYGRESFSPRRPLVEAVLELTARIHRDFAYDTHSTTVSTTLPEVMQARSGVCQDFAHLQIGCLRAMGLAARYVSGYLLTTPLPGMPRLIGADASHAWASVWIPGEGWLDVDPTNNLVPSEKHITIGFGRDFGDVSPLRGVVLGGGRHNIEVSVDVAPVEIEPRENP